MKILGLISSFWQWIAVGVGLFYVYLWGRNSEKVRQMRRTLENVEKAQKARHDVDRVDDPAERLRQRWSRD